MHNLLSSSVADMVVAHPVLAVVLPPLLRMKGSFHCHQNFHFLLDPQLVTDGNETRLINLHITHIIWQNICHKSISSFIPLHNCAPYKTVTYTVTCNFNFSLWQEMNTEQVSLTTLICVSRGGAIRLSSTSVQSIVWKKGCSRMARDFPSDPSRVAGSLFRNWK